MGAFKDIKPHPEVDIENGFYGVWKTREINGKTQEYFDPIGRACYLIAVLKQIETREQQIYLQCDEANPNSVYRFTRDEVYSQNPTQLVKLGIDAQKSNLTTFNRLLQKMEINTEKGYCHQGLGWFQDPNTGEVVFRTDVLIGQEEDIPSEYIGQCKIGRHGDEKGKAWYDLIRKYCTHTPLAFIVTAGLSSVLVGYLNLHHVEVNNPIIHLYGKSSTGKTTAGMLFLSTAASPKPDSGLYLQWSDTKNAIIQAMAGVEGYPFLIDESSVKKIEYTDIIYMIANRRDKKRYIASGGDASEPQSMSVTVLSTGESSLRSSSNRNNGLDVRLMEFSGVDWTPSAEASEEIKKVVQENYGFAIEDIASTL